jgi:hypothetical protein
MMLLRTFETVITKGVSQREGSLCTNRQGKAKRERTMNNNRLVCLLSSSFILGSNALFLQRPEAISAAPLWSSPVSSETNPASIYRRDHFQRLAFFFTTLLVDTPSPADAENFAERDAQRQYIQESYSDFTKSKEGWFYREVNPGSGAPAKEGDRVVFDWSGYTIGYFGRPFQAKG